MAWGVHDYPEPKEYTEPICPCCGESCDTIYKNRFGDIVGCSECITAYDAWDLEDEL